MASYEHKGQLNYVDEDGNEHILYPETEIDCVHGLNEELGGKAPISHTKDKNNPHGSTAEQVGARPNTWLPNIAEIGAAPAGYGLGSGAIEVTDWNDAILNGWYKSSDSGEVFNSPFPGMGCWGYTAGYYSEDGIVQVAFTYTSPDWTTDGLFQKMRFYKKTIGWSEWEWVNPPMVVGEEYRTTERYKGKPVYVHRISLGTLVKDATKYMAYDTRFMTEVVGLEANIYSARKHYKAPYLHIPDLTTKEIQNAIFASAQYGLNDDNIVTLFCMGDWTEFSADYTIKYTKD